MHEIKKERAGDTDIVVMSGEITIESAESAKDTLLDLLISGKKHVVDLSGMTKADTSFFQLLYAANRYLKLKDDGLQLSGEVPEAILREAEAVGFDTFQTDERFWG